MKITLNQTSQQFSKYSPVITGEEHVPELKSQLSSVPSMGLSLANFPNISFQKGMKPDIKFLLKQSGWLNCAYSGRKLISPFDIPRINKKIDKCPNIITTNSFLERYEHFMFDVEKEIFNLFKNYRHKNKHDYQDALISMLPAAYENLINKQTNILHSTDDIIQNLSKPVAEKVVNLRDGAINKAVVGTFTRKGLLKSLNKIKADENDKAWLTQIYRKWYRMPKSSTDIDAFIVQYSKQPHNMIAKRLLSPSVATVEHIKPNSLGGEDSLANFLLVSSKFNNDRNTLSLDEYILMNYETNIIKHLQKYLDSIIKDVRKCIRKFKMHCSVQ